MVVKVKGADTSTPLTAKSSELAAVLKGILKTKGEGVAVKAVDIANVERIPTGVFEFDLLTGGGFPRGRQSIVYGPESSGKTNICMCAVAQAQKMPSSCNKVVWVNLEGTFDPKWAARFGIDVEELIVINPAYGEEAVDLTEAVMHADDVVLVVVDSLAVMVSTKELEQSTEKFDVGTSAILVKRLVNKIAVGMGVEARRGHAPAVVFVNQTRFKIAVMFGDPETMPGGQAMKFNSSLTVRLSGKNVVDKAFHPDLPAFKDTKCVIKKAKIAVTGVETEYKIAMMPLPGIAVGQTASWNNVSGRLKAAGQISQPQKGKGWVIDGTTYMTLSDMQDHYYADRVFQLKVQAMVLALYTDQFMVIAASDAAL